MLNIVFCRDTDIASDTHSLFAVHKSRETHVRPKVFQQYSVDFRFCFKLLTVWILFKIFNNKKDDSNATIVFCLMLLVVIKHQIVFFLFYFLILFFILSCCQAPFTA